MNYNLNRLAEEKVQKKSGWAAFRKLYSLIREEKNTLLLAMVAIIINAVLSLLGPYLIGHTIDTYINRNI